MPRIYVIGALVYDLVFDVPDWLQPNLAVHASRVTMSPGGKGLNQAVAAQRLGGDATLIGCVGRDLFGDEMLKELRKTGVNVEHVYQLETAQTSVSSIIVKDNMPGFIGAPDASRRVSESQIRSALRDLGPDDILSLNFEIPQDVVPLALALGREAGATTVLNPAPFFTRDDFVIDYLHLVDALIPNMLEAQVILDSEADDPDELARGLLAFGVEQVVMTMGEAGSNYYDASRQVMQPIFPVDAVDTTGASDAFVGAYCLGLSKRWDRAVRTAFAAAVAGLSCTRHGTMSSMPFYSEVEALLDSHRNLSRHRGF